jgi:hypothetical protein
MTDVVQNKCQTSANFHISSPDSGAQRENFRRLDARTFALTSETPQPRDQDELHSTKRGAAGVCIRSTMLSRRKLTFDIEEPHALIRVVQFTRQNAVHLASELDTLMCASLMAWLTFTLSKDTNNAASWRQKHRVRHRHRFR